MRPITPGEIAGETVPDRRVRSATRPTATPRPLSYREIREYFSP